MLDRYVLGDVRRISPEAPIPVLRAGRSRAVLGGAGNVAQNVVALGGHAMLLGVVGDDEAGEAVGRALIEAGAGVRASLARAAGRPTTVKTRFMSGPHQLLRVDQETTEPIATAASCRSARPLRRGAARRGCGGAVGLRQRRAVRRGAGPRDRDGAAGGQEGDRRSEADRSSRLSPRQRADAQRGRDRRRDRHRACRRRRRRSGRAARARRHRRRTRCW